MKKSNIPKPRDGYHGEIMLIIIKKTWNDEVDENIPFLPKPSEKRYHHTLMRITLFQIKYQLHKNPSGF